MDMEKVSIERSIVEGAALYECPSCGMLVTTHDNYCRGCHIDLEKEKE